MNDFSSGILKLRKLNTRAVPHSNIEDNLTCSNTIDNEDNDNLSTSNDKDVESDISLTLVHNVHQHPYA